MFRTVLKGLWSHKRRLIGTSTAVVLGVAFLVATLVLGDTMRIGFGELITQGNAGTDVVVRNSTEIGGDDQTQRGLLDESVVEQVAQIDGVDRARRVDRGRRPGDRCRRRADRWSRPTDHRRELDRRSRPQLVPHRRGPRAPAAPNEVVLDASTADRGDLASATPRWCAPRSLWKSPSWASPSSATLDGISGATYVAFTTEAAQQYLLGDTDHISTVVVHADAGESPDVLRDRIAQVIPADAEALTGAEIDRRAEGRPAERLHRLLRDVPAGVRRHRDVGRHVQHPQHVLDPGGAAHS